MFKRKPKSSLTVEIETDLKKSVKMKAKIQGVFLCDIVEASFKEFLTNVEPLKPDEILKVEVKK